MSTYFIFSAQCMFLIGSFVPSFLVDRLGRRRPMMIGSFGLGLSMMMIAVLLSFQGTSVAKPTASASVAFFFTVRKPALLPWAMTDKRNSICLFLVPRSIVSRGFMFQKFCHCMPELRERPLVSLPTGSGYVFSCMAFR